MAHRQRLNDGVCQPVMVVKLAANLIPHLTKGVQTVVYLLKVLVLLLHDLLQGRRH